jgi:hypothetical protein
MRCKCSGCGAAFAGLAAFEQHRVGALAHTGGRRSTRRCLVTPDEMRAAGLRQIVTPASRRNPAGATLWTLAERVQVTVAGQGAARHAVATYLGQTRGLWDVPETAPDVSYGFPAMTTASKSGRKRREGTPAGYNR